MFESKNFRKKTKLSVEAILQRVASNSLFEYYIGHSIEVSKKYQNPFNYADGHSVAFFISRAGEMLMKDFKHDKTYSVFSFIMEKYGVTFISALQMINRDFKLNLADGKIDSVGSELYTPSEMIRLERKEVDIRAKVRKFTPTDLSYWKQGEITEQTLKKLHIYSAKAVWINDRIYYTDAFKEDLCFLYHDPDFDKLKVYRPLSPLFKWRSNLPADSVCGFHLLREAPEGSDIYLTSSRKDTACFVQLDKIACNFQGEGFRPPQRFLDVVNDRKLRVNVWYDNDEPGIENAKRLRDEYGFSPYALPEYKDPFEFVKNTNLNCLKILLDDSKQIL